MFASFFPNPRLFALSVVIWSVVGITVWYTVGEQLGAFLGFAPPPEEPIVGVSVFWSPAFLWFYIYYAVFVGVFAAFWMYRSHHPWTFWSILGSAFILFATYFQVQVSVAINAWYGPFYDLIQAALAQTAPVTIGEFFGHLATFAIIAFVAVAVAVFTRFFISHYIFRWRTAMNNFYMANWGQLRGIEGASQRVQEDTMRFASIMEGLGANLVDSLMTIVAFLPVLLRLSVNVTEIPIIGEVPYALVLAAIFWSLFGTAFLALIGIRLPGLEFRNQRVEAAYRKELVFGEDDPKRADPITAAELFHNVRRNYFRLYFNYMYFNVGRFAYLQTDNIFPYIILAPTIVAGKITLGPMQQILSAFGQVRSSFQYLVYSWTTIVEMISIYKRLQAFEATLHGGPLSGLESTYETIPTGAYAAPSGE